MRLLITTQALDTQDPILGFFVRWVEEIARHCEQVTVICLRRGEYTLPSNVRVFALGGGGKASRAYKLLKGAYKFRGNYDAVFVHMNPEYIVAAGWLWRLLGKRIVLWYTHKSVDLKLRVATLFADAVLTASKESFRLPTKKLAVVGHGIDTNFFSPDPSVARSTHYLSVGRLMKSKRHDLAMRKAKEAGVSLRIAGSGPEQDNLEALAAHMGVATVFLGGITQIRLRDEYRRAAKLIHTSETGSLDKVVLEALACGLLILTNDPALKNLESEGSDYVREHHSLGRLAPRIIRELAERSHMNSLQHTQTIRTRVFAVAHSLFHDHALLVRYVIAGVAGIIANALTFYIFNELLGLWYLYAVVPAFVVGLVAPFLLQKYWTFKKRDGSWRFQVGNYLLISFINLGVNALLAYLLVSVLGMWPMAGQLISLGVIAFTGFVFNRLVTFHD